MSSPSSSSILRSLLIVVLSVCCLLEPVSSLRPVCSVASASRPSLFPSGTSSYTASLGSYALYAETSFTTFINNMYDYSGQYLFAQQGSTNIAGYWNTAVAVQGLLQYASFHASHGIGGLGWGASTVISTAQSIVATQQTESGENDSELRDGYNDGTTRHHSSHSPATRVTHPSARSCSLISAASWCYRAFCQT